MNREELPQGVQNLGSEQIILWKDTKKWVEEVAKRLKYNNVQVARLTGLPTDAFDAWYSGAAPEVKITTLLRQWIKKIVDQNANKHQPASDLQKQQQSPMQQNFAGASGKSQQLFRPQQNVSSQYQGNKPGQVGRGGQMLPGGTGMFGDSAGALSVDASAKVSSELMQAISGYYNDYLFPDPTRDELPPFPRIQAPVEYVEAKPPPDWSPDNFFPSSDSAAEKLVPIRLEIHADGRSLRDVVIWKISENNGKGDVITPEQFARHLCEDTDLPPTFEPLIVNQMNDQINDFLYHGASEESVQGCIDEDSYGNSTERLHKIKIDVRVNDFVLEDQFLWDLKSPNSDVDFFVDQYCNDLQLPSDLRGLIAHKIREKIFESRKKIRQGRDAGIMRSIRIRWRESDKREWGPNTQWLTVKEREMLDRNSKKQRRMPG
ncbi:hypothetical protein GUITHDRAFT_133985 [Guillardia theta CCMP2712]|uniref:Uncharacterized protein n=1 Tax=Guillardia theta (strain CCMP2712) TaxID=905079 RepID=L1JW29_GUITC|nr:hypothetical protein GUITHDRAFT_133985 [Guillardia theta CCMP2712]EKX52283.1 hypothetical protein GUITHDRAFT_133985 [Guillardia theta CCMP2712]|eukprot:XP_005839263.1 hypothetical protein GUITHDRAFT_133985 [Guillardia theta CCMP2712]